MAKRKKQEAKAITAPKARALLAEMSERTAKELKDFYELHKEQIYPEDLSPNDAHLALVALDAGDLDEAIVNAMTAFKMRGMTSAFNVVQPQIAKANKVDSDAKKARRKKEAKTAARREAIVEAVRSRLKEHPHDSVDYARHAVEKDHLDSDTRKPATGWSYSSIRRATLGMKKPKRK